MNHPSILAIRYTQRQAPERFNFHHTNMVLVEEMLKYINTRKACGYNMLPPRLIKDSASAIAKPLTVLFNCSIDRSRYPASWKMEQITPIFKKDDELNKANYRPVTVLPALNNIFERLLAAQLGDFYNSILSDYISSYRKFHSRETSLLRMTEEWRRMRDQGDTVAVVSMDLSKAFDVIQHSLLLAKLKAHGLDQASCALIKDYLSSRYFFRVVTCKTRRASGKRPRSRDFQYFHK